MNDLARQRAATMEQGSYARRLGARAGDIGTGVAEVTADYRQEHANTYGLVHGGVAASLALWAASLAAWSSQRPSAGAEILEGRALSLHVSYLEIARQEPLRAVARVSQRGREAIHLHAEVFAGEREVARALLAYRIGPPVRVTPSALPTPRAFEPGTLAKVETLPKVSPFIRSAGIELCRADRELAAMTMPLAGNQNAAGLLDEGALVGCIDTCAALACKAFHERMPAKSTTLSLSVAFGLPVDGDVAMVGRLQARDGEIFTTTVEASSGDHSSCAASAVVVYRFA